MLKIIMKKKKYLRYGKLIHKIFLGCILINSPLLISLAVAEEYKSQIRSENFKEVFFVVLTSILYNFIN